MSDKQTLIEAQVSRPVSPVGSPGDTTAYHPETQPGMEKEWPTMSDQEKSAIKTLGFTKEKWDAGDISFWDKNWLALSRNERNAARELGADSIDFYVEPVYYTCKSKAVVTRSFELPPKLKINEIIGDLEISQEVIVTEIQMNAMDQERAKVLAKNLTNSGQWTNNKDFGWVSLVSRVTETDPGTVLLEYSGKQVEPTMPPEPPSAMDAPADTPTTEVSDRLKESIVGLWAISEDFTDPNDTEYFELTLESGKLSGVQRWRALTEGVGARQIQTGDKFTIDKIIIREGEGDIILSFRQTYNTEPADENVTELNFKVVDAQKLTGKYTIYQNSRVLLDEMDRPVAQDKIITGYKLHGGVVSSPSLNTRTIIDAIVERKEREMVERERVEREKVEREEREKVEREKVGREREADAARLEKERSIETKFIVKNIGDPELAQIFEGPYKKSGGNTISNIDYPVYVKNETEVDPQTLPKIYVDPKREKWVFSAQIDGRTVEPYSADKNSEQENIMIVMRRRGATDKDKEKERAKIRPPLFGWVDRGGKTDLSPLLDYRVGDQWYSDNGGIDRTGNDTKGLPRGWVEMVNIPSTQTPNPNALVTSLYIIEEESLRTPTETEMFEFFKRYNFGTTSWRWSTGGKQFNFTYPEEYLNVRGYFERIKSFKRRKIPWRDGATYEVPGYLSLFYPIENYSRGGPTVIQLRQFGGKKKKRKTKKKRTKKKRTKKKRTNKRTKKKRTNKKTKKNQKRES